MRGQPQHPIQMFGLLVAGTLVSLAWAGVPLQRYEALMKQQSTELGLYNASDKVEILTSANFRETIINRNQSALVEFYNSYCGHCKRFAPLYKDLAEQLHPWRDVLRVAAIDCAAEENNDICREYEVMAYPSLRYFGPGYTVNSTSLNGGGENAAGEPIESNNYGRKVDTQHISKIRSLMAEWVAAENRTASMTNWPNFARLDEADTKRSLFEGLDSQREYVVLVHEADNSTTGVETILNLRPWPAAHVRRISDPDLEAKYQMDSTHPLAVVDRKGVVVPYTAKDNTSKSYADTIESVLKAKHFTERPEAEKVKATPSSASPEQLEHNHELLQEVLRNKHLVYQADLEMAIRGMLYNEIPKTADISGERLMALQRFMALLKRYNPLGHSGRQLVDQLHHYVMQHNEHLTGKQFEDELLRLQEAHPRIFSAHQFVGCAPSRPGLRGFTCSVWKLFHFLTVQAATNEISQDPLEVLQAMHGYIKYFFGCTDCAEHFQAMATLRKIWSTPNKDEAVLWLWAAHNEVNQRLAGDDTEDPKFPKIQFPSVSSCSQCYNEPPQMSPASLDYHWNKDAVLQFLKNINNPEYVSRYGLDNDDQLHATAEKLQAKRNLSNVFSDMDMRMGMLLYGFCVVMLVVAFKLFVFKGYRKKPYAHDMLGKV